MMGMSTLMGSPARTLISFPPSNPERSALGASVTMATGRRVSFCKILICGRIFYKYQTATWEKADSQLKLYILKDEVDSVKVIDIKD